MLIAHAKSLLNSMIEDMPDDVFEQPMPKVQKKAAESDDLLEIDDDEESKEDESEVNEYPKLKVKEVYENPLDYWAKSPFKKLKKIAEQIFSIPASSANSERGFSCSGRILRKDRARMATDTLSSMSCYTINRSLDL